MCSTNCPADDQEQVQRFGQQLFQSVLPVLRGAANRVEETEVPVELNRTEFLLHGSLEPPLHLFRLSTQHRRLVGDADRLQVEVRIESRE